MSQHQKNTIRICQRAAYLLFNKTTKTCRVLSDRPNDMAALRRLITRCYQIS